MKFHISEIVYVALNNVVFEVFLVCDSPFSHHKAYYDCTLHSIEKLYINMCN